MSVKMKNKNRMEFGLRPENIRKEIILEMGGFEWLFNSSVFQMCVIRDERKLKLITIIEIRGSLQLKRRALSDTKGDR